MAKTSDPHSCWSRNATFISSHPPLPFPLPALSSLLEKDKELEDDKVTAADTYTGLRQEFWFTGIQEIGPRATLWPPHLGELLIL